MHSTVPTPLSPRSGLCRLRRAADRLAPVVVDFGSNQAKLASYVTEVRGRGQHAYLYLSPIAAHAIPPSHERAIIRSTARDRLSVSAASLERVDDQTARAPLAGASFHQLPERLRPRHRADPQKPLTLLFPHGLHEADVDILPAVDLSVDACAVDSPVGLPPGAALGPVMVLGDRGVLRQAEASVVETQPWWMADGTPRFRCLLRLTEVATPAAIPQYDMLEDPERIRRVLELTSLLDVEVVLEETPGNRTTASATRLDASELHFPDATRPVGPIGRLRLQFELFDVSYSATVRVLSKPPAPVVTSLPLVMTRRRRRREGRAEIPPEQPITVRFRNPATRTMTEAPLVDLSFRGMCFSADARRELLWKTLPLESVELLDGGDRIPLGDAELRGIEPVRSNSTQLCHAELVEPRPTENAPLADLLARLRYPALQVQDGRGFDQLVQLFREAGLVVPHIERNLQASLEECRHTWLKLHERGSDICRTLTRYEDTRPVATMSTLQGYEGTWIGQHMAAHPERSWRSPGALLLAYIDHVLMRPDFKFMAFFAEENNERMISIHERFCELTGTAEAFGKCHLDIWCSRAGSLQLQHDLLSDYLVHPMRRNEELVASRAAERALGPIPTHALGLIPGGFRMSTLSRQFRRRGLRRTRECELIKGGRRPLAALLHEDLSPGANLTWLLNASWFIPIHGAGRGAEDACRKALGRVAERPPSPAGDRFVLAPAGMCPHIFREAGFERLTGTKIYALNRAGLRRYAYYLSQRSGESTARYMARTFDQRKAS